METEIYELSDGALFMFLYLSLLCSDVGNNNNTATLDVVCTCCKAIADTPLVSYQVLR